MGLEAATYISSLVSTNPAATDGVAQGDDHVRLLKAVVQSTFPNADRAWRMPEFVSKTANYTVLGSDENKIILCDTSGGSFTLTLPTPGFDGWMVTVLKTTTDANCVFVAPPSGNIATSVGAVAKVRVNVPYAESRYMYTGSAFCKLDGLSHPGTTESFYGATAPAGFVFAYGQTLSGTSADYPELYAVRGTLVMPDLRGRLEYGKDDMGGSAASRVTTAGGAIDGATLGAAGGLQSVSILQANIPNVNFAIASGQWTPTITVTNTQDGGDAYCGNTAIGGVLFSGGGTAKAPYGIPNSGTYKVAAASSSNGAMVAASGGSGTALQTLPPGVVCNKIMRLC